MKIMQIYYEDLNKDAQQQVLDLFNLKDESEGNFELVPLAELHVEDMKDAILEV